MKSRATTLWLILIAAILPADFAWGQPTSVGTPFVGVSDSYYESFGTAWGVQGRGWFFNWGGGNAVPPFGPYDPNAVARGGFGFGGGGLRGHFGFYAAQGSDRGMSSVTPSVVVPNGGYGGVIDTTYRPFITEITPVVGESALASKLRNYGRPPYRSSDDQPDSRPENPVQKSPAGSPATPRAESHYAGRSSATQGTASLASIREQSEKDAALREAELQAILDSAIELEKAGDKTGAASQYAKAAHRIEDERRQVWLDKARRLRKKD